MSVVNTNVKSLFAQNSLKVNERSLTRAMEQLSTGKRISSAKDDAAGLAIGTKMSSDLRGMSMAIRNANDGISMMQTAEGALGEITNMLQRMRELAVQSSTGSLTAVNRASLQTEMDQLVAEIDNIARTSNFNGIKLLDGSAQSVALQTGVNEGDQVTVGIGAASSKALGLQGFRVEGEVTSGRVGTFSGLAAGAVLINGKEAFATGPITDNNEPDYGTAKDLARAINSNIGLHRVTATAFNTLKGAAPTDTSFATGDLTINGNAIGPASSVEELVANINRDAAGVTATLAKDGSIELSNDTGADIIIDGDGAIKAGFTAKTYTGYVTLSSLDGADISIKAMSPANGFSDGKGTVADVKLLGFNESVDGSTYAGTQVNDKAITLADDLRINGVQVGPSADDSALAKAAALNAISAQTGVTASARTEVVVTVNVKKLGDASAVEINGKKIDLSEQTSINGVIDTINGEGVNGVTASTDQSGNLLLTSDSGADIVVKDASSFVIEVASVSGDFKSTEVPLTSAVTVKGRISLSSDTGADIRVESRSTDAATLIGFAEQGGSDTLVGGALSISTQDAAGRAITAIDGAIENVSSNRSTLGAFQNRLVAAVDNLSTSSTNLAESRSRIMDAEYASVTTELARSQIIQQAATAMLAQANQSSQSVLSLLQQ